MTCRSRSCAAATHFSSKVAEEDLARYQRRGPDASTRMLLTELRRWPLQGLRLLDVGSGIGVIAMELTDAGLAAVTLADASPAYLEFARRRVEPLYASRLAKFILGDFAVSATTLPDADVVTLDRVVWCYPDVDALLQAASLRARHIGRIHLPPRLLVLARRCWRGKLLVPRQGQRLSGFRSLARPHGRGPGSLRIRPRRASRDASVGARSLPPPKSRPIARERNQLKRAIFLSSSPRSASPSTISLPAPSKRPSTRNF
jgi:SAM-dependent methyltransferase